MKTHFAVAAVALLVLGPGCDRLPAGWGPNSAAVPGDADGPPTTKRIKPRPIAVPELPEPPKPPPPPSGEELARQAQLDAELLFERTYPKYGVSYHFLAQVFEKPSIKARPIGYMRRGAQFRVKADPVRGGGCAAGWYEVPGPGFVCRGVGYTIGDEVQTFEPSPEPPSLDSALPYAYGKVVSDSVGQYWQLPTREQEAAAGAIMERLALAAEAKEAATTPASTEDGAGPSAVEAPPPPGRTEVVGAATPAGPIYPDFFRMPMMKGFYVSLDGVEETPEETRFVRTVRGAYLRQDRVAAPELPKMRGVVLGGQWNLPIAVVYRTGVHQLSLDAAADKLIDQGEIARHTAFPILEEFLNKKNKAYAVGTEGVIVREPSVRVLRAIERPSSIPAEAKWIHVNLAAQTLLAYEGDAPVFGTLVSTGKEGFSTPTGLYSIQSKHVSTTMDDLTSEEDAYSIEDVPWTMYFFGNYALHGAFWHDTFGRVRSHGCVNLAPSDARWLFQWSTPTLPQSWHGAFATRGTPGTWVYITAR